MKYTFVLSHAPNEAQMQDLSTSIADHYHRSSTLASNKMSLKHCLCNFIPVNLIDKKI